MSRTLKNGRDGKFYVTCFLQFLKKTRVVMCNSAREIHGCEQRRGAGLLLGLADFLQLRVLGSQNSEVSSLVIHLAESCIDFYHHPGKIDGTFLKF